MKKTITILTLVLVLGLTSLMATLPPITLPPTITSFTPASGAIGSSVTITGTNFNTTAAQNIVFFGATKAVVIAASATSLTVTVPLGATYQYLSVTNLAVRLTAYSAKPFNVTLAGSITFTDKVDFATGTSPFSVRLGDIDGDGKVDLVINNYSSKTISVFRNTSSSGTVSFADKVDLATVNYPLSVSIVDIDGDGKPDFVVANAGSYTVSVFRNISSGTTVLFETEVDFETVNFPTNDVSIGDIDGDGKPDLVMANSNSTISVLRNTSTSGNLSFATKVDFATSYTPNYVSIGDIDGDGKVDLAVVNADYNTVSVLRNISSGTTVLFETNVNFATGSIPRTVSIGDIDGDGKADLVVANIGDKTVSVFRNISSGTTVLFQTKVDFATGISPFSVSIGDIDGDGKADLAVVNASGGNVSVLRNASTSGNLSFSTMVNFATGISPRSVSIGDIDGDGKPDLVVVNNNSNTVSVIRQIPPHVQVSATLGNTFGGYATLKTAFDSINSGYHKGVINIAIIANTTETASAVLNASGTGTSPNISSYNSITISPSGGVARTISGNLMGQLILLNGADSITIDGLNTGGNSLTFDNSSTYMNASTLYINSDASNNTIANCTILGSSTSTSNSATVVFGNNCPATGNDNNNINHCNIGPSGSNLPYCAIQYSGGSTEATANSGNTLSYNNIYDWYSPTSNDYAIYIVSSYINRNCTIDHNSFYQTASRTKTSISYYYSYAMYLSGSTPINYSYGETITNNYIGGSAPQCAGAAMSYTGAAGGRVSFQPIFLNMGTTTPTTIKNNIIKNISLTAEYDVTLIPISVQSGAFEIDNNTIGSSTDNANITLNSTAGGVSFYGIYNTNTASISSINNNTIGGITMDGKDVSGNRMNAFYGINIASTSSTIDTIKNNLIGSLTTANSVSITNSTGVCRMFYEGINLAAFSLGIMLIDSNIIANLSIIKDATRVGVDKTGGIYSAAVGATISNNTIYNLKNGLIYSSTPGTNYEYYAPLVGIYLNHASGTTTVCKNKIYALLCISTTSTLQMTMAGIYKEGNGLAVIDRNLIYGISTTATTPAGFLIRGISSYLTSAPTPDATLTIKNNIISLGLDETGANIAANHVYTGINLNYVSGRNVYYNTCYIGGSAASGSCNSYAYYQTGTAAEDIRNNIFYNARTNTSATGKHYAISSTDGTFTSCDYNDYYTSGTGGVLGQLNTADKTSLLSWQATTSGDTHSYTKNPALSNAGGILAANYLPSHPNLVAAIGTGITTDYTGTTRSITLPAMGANEYTVIPFKPVEVTASLGTTGPSLYTNLKAAFDSINTGYHKGAITIKINDNTTETESAKLNASGSGTSPNISSYSSVNIYPTATGLTIGGNLPAPLIDLNGSDTVTINGSLNGLNAGKDLQIINVSTLATAGTSTIRFINDASYNTVKYCTIKGSTYDANAGVLFFSTGTTTGNLGNHIDNNNITNADNANRPRYTIYSLGTSDIINNSQDTISNNNIYDFLNKGVSSYGIFLSSYSTAWAVTANNFYETTTFAPTGAFIYYPIYIGNTSGNNFTVNDNYIGGSASDHTGTWSVNAASAHTFYGIYLSVDTTTASSVQNNTIQSISYTSTSDALWRGINISAGKVNIGTITGNTIGSATVTGSIMLTNATAYAYSYGVYIASPSTVNFQNNIIGGITTIGSATIGHSFNGIYKSAKAGTTTLSNNCIKNIIAQSTATSNIQSVIGILSSGSGAVTIVNDSIYNLTNNTTNATVGMGGFVQGIVTTAGTNTITGNIVHDLTIANANNSLTNGTSVIGISQMSSTIKQNVSGNTIYNLSNTYSSFGGGVIGLYYTGATTDTNTVSKNFIYGLSATSASASLYGIKIDGGTATYANNIISLGTGITTGNTIYGIKLVAIGGNTLNLYYNTIDIEGTATGVTGNTYALSNIGGNTRIYKNNIFNNSRLGGTTGKHYAVSIIDKTNLTCDYNDYYAPNGVLGVYNTIDEKTTLIDWATSTGGDTHSKNANPTFASAGGTLAANYLPSQSSLVAATGTGITTDYAGTVTRSASIPSMGAWEYTLCNAPSISSQSTAAQKQCLSGTFAPITVTATGDTLSYQWYKNATGNTTDGFKVGTNSYSYTPLADTAGTKYYYCVVTSTCGSPLTSAVSEAFRTYATFTPGAIASTGQAICYNGDPAIIGSTTAASGGNDTITYEWYKSTTNFIDSTLIGSNTSTYDPPTNLTITTSYRRYAHDGSCNTSFVVSSGTWTVTVNAASNGGNISGGANVCNGINSTVLTLYSHTGSVVKWQYTDDMGYHWYDISNTGTTNTATNLITTTSFRAVVKSGVCDDIPGSYANVNVQSVVTAGTIATAQTICNNTTPVALSSATAGTGSNTITYEWRTNASGSYATIGSEIAAGYQPPTLTATTNYQRRTVSTIGSNVCYSDYTSPITMTVYSAFASGAITTTGETICYNTNPIAEIGSSTIASGGDNSITYSWRSSADSYASAISGATLSTYTPAGPLTTTTSYQRYVKDNTCNTTPEVSTGTWTVTVRDNFAAGSIASTGESICYNTNPSTEIGNTTDASGGDNSITYEWRSSADSYSSAISGATASTYIPASPVTATTSYQRYTNDNTCNTTPIVSTGTWTVTVNPLPVPTISGPTGICNNSAGNVYITEEGKSSYVWTVPGGTITAGAGTNTITVTCNNDGAQTVSVNYINSYGCTAASATIYNVTVKAAPSPIITGSPNNFYSVPKLATYQYSTPANVGNLYSWSAPGLKGYCSSTAKNCVFIQFEDPCGSYGQWTINVIETNPTTGCSATATKLIYITP